MGYKMAETAMLDNGLTAIADALRSRAGSTERLDFPDGMVSEVEAVYEAGKTAAQDNYWETFQNGGEYQNYMAAFAFDRFTDDTFDPKYDILVKPGQTTGQQMFFGAPRITDTKVAIITHPDGTYLHNTFSAGTYGAGLKRIRKLRVYDTTTYQTAFVGQIYLEELMIEGTIGENGFNVSWSPLNKASLTSIVNALSAETDGLTVTLGLSAVDKAFETAEGAADGAASETWLALAATKSNWTISLV